MTKISKMGEISSIIFLAIKPLQHHMFVLRKIYCHWIPDFNMTSRLMGINYKGKVDQKNLFEARNVGRQDDLNLWTVRETCTFARYGIYLTISHDCIM